MTCCFFIVTIRGGFPIELRLDRNNSFVFKVVRIHKNHNYSYLRLPARYRYPYKPERISEKHEIIPLIFIIDVLSGYCSFFICQFP